MPSSPPAAGTGPPCPTARRRGRDGPAARPAHSAVPSRAARELPRSWRGPGAAVPAAANCGDPAGQTVLENVVGLLEEADVVEELGGAEAGQGIAELVLWHVGDGLEQGDGHV